MSKRVTKHELDERIQIVRRVLEKRKSIKTTAKEHEISEITLKGWIRKYQADGVDGLKESRSWKTYSAELKQQAVEFYLYKGGSLESTCKQFNISSRSVLQRWINHYTSGKEIKSTSKGSIKMNGGIYGYRRIRMVIQRKYGKRYNLKRIRRLMILLGLKSFILRSNGYSTKTSYVNIEENILNREFTADKPNQKWVTDITHLKYSLSNKAYLSVIKNLYDGSIVAYKIDYYNDNELVMETSKQL